ncbi:hypothetical protein Z950_1507 [Sulfitobacter mediterraneus KCTC 32188]|nr:hypothetical protein Z950_1507 [Sulfitobacter mediterraneus KCTC 32188]
MQAHATRHKWRLPFLSWGKRPKTNAEKRSPPGRRTETEKQNVE